MVERPTERVNLPDGSWMDVYTQVTRGMRKKFRQATLAAIKGRLDINMLDDLTDQERLKQNILSNPGVFDLAAVDDAYLMAGIKGWSFPEPVTMEAIDNLPDEHVEQALARLRVLYAEVSEEEGKGATGIA